MASITPSPAAAISSSPKHDLTSSSLPSDSPTSLATSSSIEYQTQPTTLKMNNSIQNDYSPNLSSCEMEILYGQEIGSSRETDNSENPESSRSTKKVKLRDNDLEVGTGDGLVMIASLQADTIDYKKVVIKGNESEAVAVPAFEGQSH
uniref:Uncharacterized protein n=1 Tax=Populus trichocarpa TaxID=3694 RepID=A0A2K1R7U5_POPTR